MNGPDGQPTHYPYRNISLYLPAVYAKDLDNIGPSPAPSAIPVQSLLHDNAVPHLPTRHSNNNWISLSVIPLNTIVKTISLVVASLWVIATIRQRRSLSQFVVEPADRYTSNPLGPKTDSHPALYVLTRQPVNSVAEIHLLSKYAFYLRFTQDCKIPSILSAKTFRSKSAASLRHPSLHF